MNNQQHNNNKLIQELSNNNKNLFNQINDLKSQVSSLNTLLNSIVADNQISTDAIEKELLKREMLLEDELLHEYQNTMEIMKSKVKDHSLKFESVKSSLKTYYENQLVEEKKMNATLRQDNSKLHKNLSQCLEVISDLMQSEETTETESLVAQLQQENETLRKMMN